MTEPPAVANVSYKKGNLLEDNAQLLVNPVNCYGVMGAGLALAFKNRWPNYYERYNDECCRGRFGIGMVLIHHMPDDPERFILSFPTKRHYRHTSRLEDIVTGLNALTKLLTPLDPSSIAFPRLGCGLGGLNWKDVEPLLLAFAERTPEWDVRVYI